MAKAILQVLDLPVDGDYPAKDFEEFRGHIVAKRVDRHSVLIHVHSAVARPSRLAFVVTHQAILPYDRFPKLSVAIISQTF